MWGFLESRFHSDAIRGIIAGISLGQRAMAFALGRTAKIKSEPFDDMLGQRTPAKAANERKREEVTCLVGLIVSDAHRQ